MLYDNDIIEHDGSRFRVTFPYVDDDGDPMGDTESVWGIESDATDYLEETAHELAGELLHRLAHAA